jgi:hypothetical protein
MNYKSKEKPNGKENTIRNTIYSVGIDQSLNLRERIAQVHGSDSLVMKAANELDCYVSNPEIKKNPWYWNFYRKVKSGMWCLYPHANDIGRTQMAHEFIEELFNSGYIRALQTLSMECGKKHVSFCQEYANSYGVSIGSVLLFGPRGGAAMELLHFLAAERIHGQHRPGIFCNPNYTETTKNMWYNAQRSCNWPRAVDDKGEEVSMDVSEERGSLPDGITAELREIWRCNPALYNYVGTNRLSGDTPFQIIEDVFDIVIRRKLSSADKAMYNRIVEKANQQGIDSFYAVYKNLFTDKDRLHPYWNEARKLLYDYAISLWEAKNEIWLAEKKRVPANGTIFRAKNSTAAKSKSGKNKVPGTIYLNNGRYYWVVARKMTPRPLIDPNDKPELPGSFLCGNGRYYWYVPGWVRRQRLAPNGEKFSTKDKTTALRIAKKLWTQIKKSNPKLAANIMGHTRVNGMATKDRDVAEKVAAEMWKHIQKKNPRLAAKILQDNRPESKDHWYAQIVAERKHQSLGSFKTRTEAEAAYAKEFEKIWGYPPGYNVQSIPKIDKVWPIWQEQKTRLSLMDEHPRLPVIGKSAGTETLEPMIRKMQRVDWLVNNCIVVLDDDSPVASKEVAIQSRGEKWYAEIKKQGKRPVIRGSTSIDKDTGRIRITVYGQGFSESRVLTEEVYHIVYEIIRHASPRTFASIKKWYSNRLKSGLDPTWYIHEAFAELMVQEGEFPCSTDLPRRVVNYAQRVFSPGGNVPNVVMEKIRAGV